MAGPSPMTVEQPDPFGPFELPELEFGEQVDNETRKTLREVEAYTLLGNNFDVKLPEDYSPPAVEPDPDYSPPTTLEDTRAHVEASRASLAEYRKTIEEYAEETRGVLPMDDRSTGEILDRAGVIARGRRDVMHALEQLDEVDKLLAEAEAAAQEDPGFWQKALGVAMDALGVAEPLLNFLTAAQQIIAGRASQASEVASPEMFDVELGWQDRIANPITDIAALFDPDAPIRRRGREFNVNVARTLTVLENKIMDTPVLGAVYGYATPTGLTPKIASAITGYTEEEVRDFRNQLAFEIVTDPLNIIDVGAGALTKTSRLRELSRVGAGVLDKAALKKTLDELPELARALGSAEEAFDAASKGDIVTRLRIHGRGPDEAAELAKLFDTERVRNLTNLRQLASNDPAEFAKIGREALDPAMATTKSERLAHAAQVKYLDRIHEFGRATDKNFVDPIIGRSWYEQAMLGQRLAAMQPIIQRFGDKPWLQNTIRYGARPWMLITGTSLKHDISDKAELLELYYMQQLRKMDQGAEFSRYEMDVARHAANVLNGLNGLNEQQALRVQEAAIPLIEKVRRGERMVAAGKAFPDDDGLAQAAYQYAKWYEFDAGTARAIENRFNFRVAELSGDLGYFGREFSDELQAKIFNNKRAREWLWGEKARRGLDNISTAWLGYEKQRKYKDLDFFESERELRDGLRRAGLNIADDEILWKRDGFDILSKRLQRSRQIAERRGLVYGWVDVAGRADPVLLDTAKGILDEMGAVRVARAAENVAEAGAKADVATDVRAGFEAGRGAVRQAGKAAAREAESAPQAAQAAADIGSAPKDLRASLKVEKDLRKMFPGAEGIADDAEDAMRGMAQAVSERVKAGDTKKAGTILSRDAQRRANEATERFYVAYQGATNTKEYRAAVRMYEQELKQIVPPAMVKDFAKRAEQALKQLDRLETAQAAVAKPVAAAVRKQESAALKNLEKAQERMVNADVAAMSPEAKAQWVQSTLTGQGVRPAPGNVSALEVMQKSKIPMPDDLDELARLHVTEFTPNQAEEFRRLHDKLYWKDMQPEHILDNIAKVVIDYPKAVFQGTVLARWASLSKDLIGNAVNLAMNPRTIPYFTKALRDAWKASRDGEFADDVAELQAIGVLRTSRQEVLEGGSDIARLIPGQAGLAAERVGKMGLLAGSIKTLDKAVTRAAKAVGIKLKEGKQLAEGIAGYRDFKLQARQIFEEAGRIATYREALSRGYSKLEAVEEVYKWWGKFDELSKLEKTVLNRILFFWSWMVRSVPVAIRHLVEHPVRSKLVLSLLAGDVTNDENMPPWLRRMGGWVLGDDGDGKVRAMSTLGSSWFSPLFSALQGEAANRLMNGQPWEAAQGAIRDVVRSSPPHVQGAIEYVTEYDLFTQKPLWQDRNAKVGSNAKAPTALWWFYGDKGDTAIAKILGLKATGRSGEPQFLTMDPRWSWFFGMMPGVETTLTDVSAFFRPTETSEIVPEIDLVKGAARLAGIPIYDVPMETGARQLREIQGALLRAGDGLSGHALAPAGGRLAPSDRTTRGREIRAFRDIAKKHGRETLGMSAEQADRYALNQMAARYPDEFRLLDLQYRHDRWERHLKRTEEGMGELEESLSRRIELLNRRALFDRVAKEELKQALALYKEMGLTPARKSPDKEPVSNADFQRRIQQREEELSPRAFEWNR